MILDLVRDNLVTYVFGNYFYFAIFLLFAFIVSLIAARINLLIGIVIAVPLFSGIVASGWIGGYGWIQTLMTIIMAIIWGFVLWKLAD